MKVFTAKLGEVTTVTWGNTSITKASYSDEGYTAFSATGPDGLLPHYEHDGPGIVLSAIGARCGKCFSANGRWTAIKNTITITPNADNNVDMRYLLYFVNRDNVWPSRGGGQPFIGLGTARDLEIPLPPLSEQKRIADILDKADAIRRKRQVFSEEIFTLTDAIFQELVGDPVTNPMGWERMTYKEAPIEIFDGDRGKEYPSSGDFSDDGFCLFLSAKNVTKRGFNFDDKSFITKEKDCSMRKGKLQRHDVVITTRGTVGNVAYFGETVPFDHIRINSGMLILRAEPRTIMPRFLSLLLQSSMFQRQVEQMRSGSAQPQLPIRTLEHMYLLLPDVKTQTTCVERIDAATKCGGTFNKASTEAVLLFNSLVQRAFKGEL